jgi:hypothetical protein
MNFLLNSSPITDPGTCVLLCSKKGGFFHQGQMRFESGLEGSF